jgi:hypothetical protein
MPPPACAPVDITVQPVQHLGRPIWTGSEYLLLTQSRPGVIQRIAADGTLGSTIALGVDVVETSWPIAWSGSELGVIHSVSSPSGVALKLARYSLDGTQLGDTIVADGVPDLLDTRTLVWAGDRYLLGWGAMGSTPTVTIEEISVDGVAATPHTVSSHGDAVFALASTGSTDLAVIGTYGPSSDLGSYVVVDRATDTASVHRVSIALLSEAVVAHEPDFVAYGSVSIGSAALQTVSASGMETSSIPAPDLGAADMIGTSHGYHLAGTSTDMATGDHVIDDVDIAGDGTQGPVNVRAMVAQDGSFVGPFVVSRGNGVATAWASGPTNAMTARLIQDCAP